MRETVLDNKWDELMSLCKKETELKRDDVHPKLVRFLGDQIDRLAKELGFRDVQSGIGNSVRRRATITLFDS